MVVKLQENFKKRRVIGHKECLNDLKNDLKIVFKSFNDAVELFNKEINQTPIEARVRLDATLFNAKIIQKMIEYFPNDWKIGKYKRFFLSVNTYQIIFKKLDKYGKPMNIKTKFVNAINNQSQLSLFRDEDCAIDPILIFGYNKTIFGEIVNPQLVYIDEAKVKWRINSNDVFTTLESRFNISTNENQVSTLNLKVKNKQKTGIA